jgi:atypical dual specificity phosphatase
MNREGALLQAEGLEAGYGATSVLAGVELRVPAKGILGILGPSGVGKSTLLRTLSRWNEALPAFWTRGRVSLLGEDLFTLPIADVRERLALLTQKLRLASATVLDNVIADLRPHQAIPYEEKVNLARQVLEPAELWEQNRDRLGLPVSTLAIGEQRAVAIARLLAGSPLCLLVDEPLRDVDAAAQGQIERQLVRAGRDRAVLLVTHNQAEARRLCAEVALLVDGQIVEASRAQEFFAGPRTSLGKDFVRYGNCWPEHPRARRAAPPERRIPNGFYWVEPGRLGGVPQPGLLTSLTGELEGLAELGCTRLVTLTEAPLAAGDELARLGIRATHFPIPDMGVPDLAAGAALARETAEQLGRGEVVVFHCRGGLGRTGTLLAATLVAQGENAVKAIDRVRSANRMAIQTDEQAAFVGQVERFFDSSGTSSC